ncbi:MAG: ABC-F family ATP-binding cassette domain-containing protein [Saprospiraceae bacterium]|nr:ABC-F family ATP-binding cassette domain-containing protein [Saprospiraceae bacterium]MDP4699421.1 ABC-F family ATP-binding cassette domain-containing protein [Saprospiraceae bacterium]MDP4813716.1 ABC-F family ATP-binding cassette domain-containing protein [Saprospiraceae bacterium]MDP4915955.1 ABC-F family ATP-binding cassette domain-containing protein [Saprospiraceae bacterium]MDP5049860.1 ABC-F family ATP-binding cassette domain-containing protein [Saprospiraceae bacterium]
MINLSNIYVQYGDRILLNKINLVIGEKDKIGLVGRNGAGKSTLLKIIAGELSPHEGNIARPSTSTLGYLHQDMEIPLGKTVLEETLTAFEEVRDLEMRLAKINEEMAHRTDYESDSYYKLLEDFSYVNDRFHYLGGDSMQADAERVLKGLGFKPSDMSRLTDEFSGGWKMRVELAKMLLKRPDYLLLDEPTNHLDIESIIWLENFLVGNSGALILISHDREFLNKVTSRTVEVELGTLQDYKASYSDYVVLREDRRDKLKSAFDNQQRVIADKEKTISRFMAKSSKTKMAQSMQKQLNKIERIELDETDVSVMNIRFPTAPRSGQVALDVVNLSKSYGTLNILDDIHFRMDRGERISFVGQNGQGKTTLAKIIVNELTYTSGEMILGHNVKIGYYAQNQAENMSGSKTVLETMEDSSPPEMRTKIRSILGAFLFSGSDAEKKVSVLSGGERARLALACLLLNPFNLLVLDEPTNHLDMLSKDVLKKALLEYDGTLIVVSHDREFLQGLTEKTLEFRDRKLFEYLGDVNFFLEKRDLQNMREVEKINVPVVEKIQTPVVSNEEKKRLQRNVQQSERKIQEFEKEIAKMENEMASPGYFDRPDISKLTEKYQTVKKQLENTLELWEIAVAEIEAAGVSFD